MERKNVWTTYDEKQLKELESHAKEYMAFLNAGKTERECIDEIVNRIEKEGYQELQALIKDKKSLTFLFLSITSGLLPIIMSSASPSMTFAAFFSSCSAERTACCILVDKEEIGSVGATGMESRFFENTVAEVMNLANISDGPAAA